MRVRRPLGDSLLILWLLVWVSASVGPYWIGLMIFGLAWVVNVIEARWIKKIVDEEEARFKAIRDKISALRGGVLFTTAKDNETKH